MSKAQSPHDHPGARLLPGLVDLQVNGCQGIDFSGEDLTEESFTHACRELFRHGNSLFLPTVITSPPERYERNLKLIARALRLPELAARIPGLHLEGPFISPQEGARGIHHLPSIRAPEAELLRQFQQWADGRIRLLTVAPCQPGVEALIHTARELGIMVSLGHHLATPDQVAAAVDAGASLVTHLGNGLPHLIHRFNNPLWECLTNDRLTTMFVADGHHLPLPLLRTILRAKGVARAIAVSDASPAALLPPGRYRVSGLEVLLEPSGRLSDPVSGYLAASSATILECANYLLGSGAATLDEVLCLCRENALALLGIPTAQANFGQLAFDPVANRLTPIE